MYTCRQILENYRHKQQQLFGVVGWRTVFLFPCVIVNFQIRKFPDSRIESPSVNSTVVWVEAWSYCQVITSRTVNAIQPFSFNEANCHPKSVEEEHRVQCVCVLSHVWLFITPWTVAPPGSSVHGIFQARILDWVAISSSGDLPDPGIEPVYPASPALAGGFFTTASPGKSQDSGDQLLNLKLNLKY